MDNGRKLQSNDVAEDWKNFGITSHPGAANVWNCASGLFPGIIKNLMSSTNQSTTHGKPPTVVFMICGLWSSQRKDWKPHRAFMRITTKSFFEMPQEKIQNALDAQRDFICEAYISHKTTKSQLKWHRSFEFILAKLRHFCHLYFQFCTQLYFWEVYFI